MISAAAPNTKLGDDINMMAVLVRSVVFERRGGRRKEEEGGGRRR